MVKHTQAIRRLLPTNCLSVFNHFGRLALKGLKKWFFFRANVKNVKNLEFFQCSSFMNTVAGNKNKRKLETAQLLTGLIRKNKILILQFVIDVVMHNFKVFR